jgi:hypothetical protein
VHVLGERVVDVTALVGREPLRAQPVVQVCEVEAFERTEDVQLGDVLGLGLVLILLVKGDDIPE